MIKNLNYHDIINKSIIQLKVEGRYRHFNEIEKKVVNYPNALWKNKVSQPSIIVWCSNDYLGMSQNNLVTNAMIESIKSLGVGSGGTRNISGNSSAIVSLEKELANLHLKERAVVFSSGYVANEASLSSLLKILETAVVFSDEKNHASIISGITKSKAKKVIFKHNDVNDLEKLIRDIPIDVPKLIVFESIYSMDGDFGNIKDIVNIAKKYNALTYLDEVHAVGLYGNTGAGLSEELNIRSSIDIIQGTLGKAYGTIGGYIASSNLICDAIRSYASGFIFTTALPPSIAIAAKESIRYLKFSCKERNLLKKNTQLLKKHLLNRNITFLNNKSHIIPVMINDPVRCSDISNILLNDFGHYIQPINYPTVPKGTERLRITPGPLHTEKMISDLAAGLEYSIKKAKKKINPKLYNYY